MSMLGIINKLKETEEKRQDFEYVLKQIQTHNLEEVQIEFNMISRAHDFDGNRMIIARPDVLTNYIVNELTIINAEIAKLIRMLGDRI